jgi:hypothetical protein
MSKILIKAISSLAGAAITAALLVPPTFKIPLYRASQDKIHHLVVGVAIVVLIYFATRRPLTSAFITLIYLICVEIVQPIFGRTLDVQDIYAGSLGCLTATLSIIVLHRFLEIEPYTRVDTRSIELEIE